MILSKKDQKLKTNASYLLRMSEERKGSKVIVCKCSDKLLRNGVNSGAGPH